MKMLKATVSVLTGLFILGMTLVAAISFYNEFSGPDLPEGSGYPFATGICGAGIAIALLFWFVAYLFASSWSTRKFARALQATVWFCLVCVIGSCVWFIVVTDLFHIAGVFGLGMGLCGALTVHWGCQHLIAQATDPRATAHAGTEHVTA